MQLLDPIHLIEVTIYSKLMSEFMEVFKSYHIDMRYVMVMMFLYFIWGRMNINMETIMESVFRKGENMSSLTIPCHKKKYILPGFNQKEISKTLYSKKFKAVTHYLIKNRNQEVSCFNEVLKIVTDNYYDEENVEFPMLPEFNQKILISGVENIYLEIIIQSDEADDDGGKGRGGSGIGYGIGSGIGSGGVTGEKKKTVGKNYTYKLSIPEKKKYQVLDDFVEKCIRDYDKDTLNLDSQMIFEYLRTHKDEDQRVRLFFREFPFKSNKYLTKNIFFEGKDKFIEYVRRFKTGCGDLCDDYENAGVTFKATMLLTGLPGTGKSCTIRGILNETGRHGVLVSWSKIKTCSDFCSIFRLTEINNKKYALKDLCFIFEDFDANNNGILKDRSQAGLCCSDVESVSLVDIEESKKNGEGRCGEVDLNLHKLLLGGIGVSTKGVRGEDDLTLECVLNVLDGIVELHGAMIIFTTNHLEKIDPAFFRSGRIDYRKEFKLASVSIIKEMVEQIRKIDVGRGEYAAYFEKMGDNLISPADVQSVCFKYTNNDADIILGELVELCGVALREGGRFA